MKTMITIKLGSILEKLVLRNLIFTNFTDFQILSDLFAVFLMSHLITQTINTQTFFTLMGSRFAESQMSIHFFNCEFLLTYLTVKDHKLTVWLMDFEFLTFEKFQTMRTLFGHMAIFYVFL